MNRRTNAIRKLLAEYEAEYGAIPTDELSRIIDFLENHPLNRMKRTISDEINRIHNIKWNHVDFTLYMVPKASPRPRSNFKNHIFYVSGSKQNKEIFASEFAECDIPMIITPMKFSSKAYLPIPKSMPKAEQVLAELGFVRPISKPDFDNLVKTYTDMITSTLIYDDALIIDGRMSKFYSWKPRIEISIEYMEEFDCEFNKNKIRKVVK